MAKVGVRRVILAIRKGKAVKPPFNQEIPETVVQLYPEIIMIPIVIMYYKS